MKVQISNDLWLNNFEDLAGKYFPLSTKEKTVQFVFDDKLDKLNSFSATLLFGWALFLKAMKKGNKVEFIIDSSKLSNRAAKLFYSLELFNTLKFYGVTIPEKYYENKPPNYPIKIIKNKNDLKIVLDDIEKRLYEKPNEKFIINDITNIIIRELIGNSLEHSNKYSYPFLFITDIEIIQKSKSTFLNGYEVGSKLLEIHVGDLGPGIFSTLHKSLPENWASSLVKNKKMTDKEKVLLYAFEYSSTSNQEKRKERIKELIQNDNISIEPEMIASGLYSMLGVVRNYGGQFLIKSFHKIIAFDFNNPNRTLEVKGLHGSQYDFKNYSKIPGTFFKIVIPLKSDYKYLFSGGVKINLPKERDIKVLNFRIPELFQNVESIFINHFISVTQKIFINNNSKPIVIIIELPINHLTSKAQQVLILHLLNHYHDNVFLVINSEHYTPQVYYDKLNLFKENKIFIGNIYKNQFHEIGYTEEHKVSTVGIVSDIFHKNEINRINTDLYLNWKNSLSKILGSNRVRLTEGPFLFEKQNYYTTVFYQIDNILDVELCLDLYSSIVANYVHDNQIKVIILESTNLSKLIKPINNKLENLFNEKIDVLVNNSHIVSQSLNFSKVKGLILTDIICTGDTIKSFVGKLTHIKIDKIFTIVDGRKENINLSFDIEKIHYHYEVECIKSEYITPLFQHPYTGSEKERIVVVDQETKRPTIKERVKRPEPEVEKEPIIKSIEANSLLTGHLEYRGKHYSFYIYFPLFFKSIQHNIEKWLNEQLSILKTTIKENDIAICFYDDDNLVWIQRFLSNIFGDKELEFITVNNNNLANPFPPSNTAKRKDWILFLPAISSGDTQMKMIEWVSRFRPNSIHLISFVTRMNWYYSNFYDGISEYRGARFTMSNYTQFPIGSHKKDSIDCPNCAVLMSLRKIIYDQHSSIQKLVLKKFDQYDIINIDDIDTANVLSYTAVLNKKEKEYLSLRTVIRSLYESAITNVGSSRKYLYKMLKESREAQLALIENISREFTLNIYQSNVMNEVLYSTKEFGSMYEIIIQLCKDILKEPPPFPLRNYLLGIAHLVPDTLSQNLKQLLINYSSSNLDFEEIICCMLITNNLSINVEELRNLEFEDTLNNKLFVDFIKYILDQRTYPSEWIRSLEIIQKIYAKLYRSSFPINTLSGLLSNKESITPLEWAGIVDQINQAYNDWRKYINEWKPSLINSKAILVIDSYSPTDKIRLVELLDKITEELKGLLEFAKSDPFSISTDSQKDFYDKINHILIYRGDINELIYDRFVVVPYNITNQKELFLTSTLQLHLEYDFQIEKKLFITKLQLDYLVKEILMNCVNYSKEVKGSYVKIVIKEEDANYVSFEFEDDIEKDYKEGGIGAIYSHFDKCKEFGAKIEISHLEEIERKSIKKIKISILKWPRLWE